MPPDLLDSSSYLANPLCCSLPVPLLLSRVARGQRRQQWGGVPSERLEVEAFVIRRPILPPAVHNPDPFEGQGPQGGMMPAPPQPPLLVVRPRPDGAQSRLTGKFVKALAPELRAIPENDGISAAFW